VIVVIKQGSSEEQIEQVIDEVRILGYTPHPIRGTLQTVIAAIGDERTHHTLESLNALPQVQQVMRVQKRYKLVSRESHPENTVIDVDGLQVGGKTFTVMAGPCSVESEEQLITTARAVKACGATVLRGGAYKPRTSPYEFQGLGREGLRLLQMAKEDTGLKIITEVLSENDVEHVAEYILSSGNPNVFLCERGIRTFETYTRNTLDLSAIGVAKKETHLPVIIDPSQGCGRSDLVNILCRGTAAMGADGLLVEVHPNPAEALSDGQQQVDFEKFAQLVQDIEPFVEAAGRTLFEDPVLA
jgi:3-deoxy-7-phosphoheptulonate synthase